MSTEDSFPGLFVENVELSQLNLFFTVEPAQLVFFSKIRVEPAQPDFFQRPQHLCHAFFFTFGLSRLNPHFGFLGLGWTENV